MTMRMLKRTTTRNLNDHLVLNSVQKRKKKERGQQRHRLQQLNVLSRISAMMLSCLLCLLLCVFVVAGAVTETRRLHGLHRTRPITTLQNGGVAFTQEEWSTTRRRILAQKNQTQATKTESTNEESKNSQQTTTQGGERKKVTTTESANAQSQGTNRTKSTTTDSVNDQSQGTETKLTSESTNSQTQGNNKAKSTTTDSVNDRSQGTETKITTDSENDQSQGNNKAKSTTTESINDQSQGTKTESTNEESKNSQTQGANRTKSTAESKKNQSQGTNQAKSTAESKNNQSQGTNKTKSTAESKNSQTQGTNKTKTTNDDKSKSCEIILDNYFGPEGLDREACSSCEKHASLDQVYVLTCNYVDVCDGPFCAIEDLGPYTCYERLDTYYVQTEDFRFFQDLGFAGCGHYTAVNEVVCLEEFYQGGYLLGRCMAVNGDPCSCNVNSKCGEFEFTCDDGAFVLDECTEDAYGTIEVGTVYTALNYQPFQEAEAQCFGMGATILPSWQASGSPPPWARTENPSDLAALLTDPPVTKIGSSPTKLPSMEDSSSVPSASPTLQASQSPNSPSNSSTKTETLPRRPVDSETTHSSAQLPSMDDSRSVTSVAPASQETVATHSPSAFPSEIETLPERSRDSETTHSPSPVSSSAFASSGYPSALPSAIEFQSKVSSPQGPADTELKQEKSNQHCNSSGCQELQQTPGSEEESRIEDKGTDAKAEPISGAFDSTSVPSSSMEPSPTPSDGCTGFGCSRLPEFPTGSPMIRSGDAKELDSDSQESGKEGTVEQISEPTDAPSALPSDALPSDMPSSSPSLSTSVIPSSTPSSVITIEPTSMPFATLVTSTPTEAPTATSRVSSSMTDVPTPIPSDLPSDLPSSLPSASARSDLPSVSLVVQTTGSPAPTKTTTDPADGCVGAKCQVFKFTATLPPAVVTTSAPAPQGDIKKQCAGSGCDDQVSPTGPPGTTPQTVGCAGADCPDVKVSPSSSPEDCVGSDCQHSTEMPTDLKSAEATLTENITFPPVIAFEASPLEDFKMEFLMETTVDDIAVLGAIKLYLYEFMSPQFDNLRAVDLTIEETATTDASRRHLLETQRLLHFHGFAIFNEQLPVQSELLDMQTAALSDTEAVEASIGSRINGTVTVTSVDYPSQSLAPETSAATADTTGRQSISVLIFIATTALLLKH